MKVKKLLNVIEVLALALVFGLSLTGCDIEGAEGTVVIYVTNSSTLVCDQSVTVTVRDTLGLVRAQSFVVTQTYARFVLPTGHYRVSVVCSHPTSSQFWYPLQTSDNVVFRYMNGTVRLDFNGGTISELSVAPANVVIYVTNSSFLSYDQVVLVSVIDTSNLARAQAPVAAGKTARFVLPANQYKVSVTRDHPTAYQFWYPFQSAAADFSHMSGTVRLNFNGTVINRN